MITRSADDDPRTCFASANVAAPLVRYPAPLRTSISRERWLSSPLTTKILAAMVSVLRPGVVGKIARMLEIPFKNDAVLDELACGFHTAR